MVHRESDILKKVLKENIKTYLMKLFPQIIIGLVMKDSGQIKFWKNFKSKILKIFDPKSAKFASGKMPSSKLLPSGSGVFDWYTFWTCPGLSDCSRFPSPGQSSQAIPGPIAAQEQFWNEILVMFSELLRLVHWKSWDNPSSDVTWRLKAI